MTVEHGARFNLRLLTSGDRITYAAEVELAQSVFRTEVGIDPHDGALSLATWAPEPGPPGWAQDYLRALLRAKWRSSEGAWPRRLTRWRAERKGCDHE